MYGEETYGREVISPEQSARVDRWYKTYRSDVYRLAYMMTHSPDCAEDICQDVFLTALRKSNQEIDARPKAWLLMVARNKTLNRLKYENRFSPMTDRLTDTLAAPGTNGPDIEFLDLLRPLNMVQRQIVLFHVGYGLKHKEIARILGLSPANTRRIYRQAIRALRTQAENF